MLKDLLLPGPSGPFLAVRLWRHLRLRPGSRRAGVTQQAGNPAEEDNARLIPDRASPSAVVHHSLC